MKLNLYKYNDSKDRMILIIGNESLAHERKAVRGVVLFEHFPGHSVSNGQFSDYWDSSQFKLVDESITLKNLRNRIKSCGDKNWIEFRKNISGEILIKSENGNVVISKDRVDSISDSKALNLFNVYSLPIDNITFRSKI